MTGDLDPEADTFPKLLIRNARTIGGRPAIRHKRLGIWQTWTWSQVADEVRAFSIGLAELGLGRGAAFAVVGTNRPRLYWAICAGQALGAVPVPVYADSVADEMAFVLEHAGAVIAVVEDQEQVDKLQEISPRLPRLSYLVYDEPRGLSGYDRARLKSFEEVQRLGCDACHADADRARRWEEGIASFSGGDLGIILYTSGTTGRPKGVMLSYRNAIVSAGNAVAFDRLSCREEVMAYLPLAWIGDHLFSYAQSYVAGYCVSCPETADTIIADRREIGPTYAFAPPRVYENLLTLAMVRMADAGILKRKMFDYFIGVAKQWGGKVLDKKPVPPLSRLLYALGELLVYGSVKNRFGFSRIRVAYTAGEAIGSDTFCFYRALGVNLKQLYGQTEASVYVSAQPDGEVYADSVGRAFPDVEIKLSESGEVLFRSPGAFVGYHKDPQETAAVKTQDGFVRTGDVGFFDAKTGHLKIIDREKDIGRLADGTLFSPKYIENKLKFYPNIKEALALGDGRDFVCAMINIDLVAVGSWAERNNVVYGSYQELAAHPLVYDMIAVHVEEVNRALVGEGALAGSQIRRFLILHKELDPDDGELTRTQKVRRRFVAERYASFARALFDLAATEAAAASEVRFEDGRKGTLTARVIIRDANTYSTPSRGMDRAA